MSVQFGRWKFDGEAASPEYLAKVRAMLSPYGPDGQGSYSDGGVDILYHAFHTTCESRSETQPHVCANGVVITWDGRLDNRDQLIGMLDGAASTRSTDVFIISAAFERWGTGCISKLIGDWALSVWYPKDRELILAKDPIGTRHLYYTIEDDRVTWCTILEPLVEFARKALTLDEEYVAGALSFLPAVERTPFVDIRSVPAACTVRINPTRISTATYWRFDPLKKIRYRTDAEYEEHFRTVFGQSVRRRLRSDAPVLAELSGGMDSSSIVCMADALGGPGSPNMPRLDTISYFNDSEPDWNERPYFTKVEQGRQHTGCHIAATGSESLFPEYEQGAAPLTPWAAWKRTPMTVAFTRYLNSRRIHVVLSGIGGDEVLGGIPAPEPELGDLLLRVHILAFGRQIMRWALTRRQPVWLLLARTLSPFLRCRGFRASRNKRLPTWIDPSFAKRQYAALTGYEKRLKLTGPIPSLQENLTALDGLRRQVHCLALPSNPCYEKRYPYLDRELLEFIYSVPRSQIVRPGQRRSLMRRSLAGIVPDQVLNRRRKAVVSRGPRAAIASQWKLVQQITEDMAIAACKYVERDSFRAAMSAAQQDASAPIVRLQQALVVEMWLRSLSRCSRVHIPRGNYCRMQGCK